MHRLASCQEKLIFDRLEKDREDPGCRLSYIFLVRGDIVANELDYALKTLIECYYPVALSAFVGKDSGVHVYSGAMPENVLEYVESATYGGAPRDSLLPDNRLFRFTLIRLSEQVHHLRLTFSHLIFDGVCYGIFCRLLGRLYGQRYTHLSYVAPESPPAAATLDTAGAIGFWSQWLSRYPLGQVLPFLKLQPRTSCTAITVTRSITGASLVALNAFIEASGSTLARLIVAATAITLSRYSDDDIEGFCIAHTLDARRQPDALGCFASLIPLWIPHQPDWSPRQYLKSVDQERRAVRPHQHLALAELLGLADERLNRNRPVLNVVVNPSEGLLPAFAPELSGLDVQLIETPSTGGPYDLAVNFNESPGGLMLSVDMPACLATEALVNQWADNLLRVLSHCVNDSAAAIRTLDIGQPLRPAARGDVMALTEADSVVARFDRQVTQSPEKIAVFSSGHTLTYAQLAEQSWRLARHLQVAIDPSVLGRGVGLLLGRSPWLAVSMLAALRLQIPFIALDSALPEQRLDTILGITQVAVVLSDGSSNIAGLKVRHPAVTLIELPITGGLPPVTGEVALSEHGNEQAYILFTSGSTGVPKGVAPSRRNLANFLMAMTLEPGFSEYDHFLALTPISFDISILEWLLPLMVGATLEIVDDDTRRSATALARHINNSKATVVQATPASWRLLKNARWSCPRTLTLLCGGEALTSEVAQFLLRDRHVLYNLYGPTETTIWASCSRVEDPSGIYLGKPVLNSRFHVVDEQLRSVSAGQAGELLISGACVSPGYLNVESGRAFVEVPGVEGPAYRTGDRVRDFGDGQLAYLGRADNQLKLNGHRIELDEINVRLTQVMGHVDVFTVLRGGAVPHLCSFYVAGQGVAVDEARVLADLEKILPAYMVPAALLRLEALPLTASGKIDVRLLANEPLAQLRVSPQGTPLIPRQEEACGEMEASVRAIIQECLGVEVQDRHMPLGWLGLNSISYNLLSQALADQLGVRLAPHRFYTLNTLAALSDALSSSEPLDDAQPRVVASREQGAAAPEEAQIAIIGYSVLMPEDLEPQAFWQALMDNRDLVSNVTRPGFSAPLHAGFLRTIEAFDARLFSISPLEANHMDPRQRLLLQTTWRTLEDAGYAPHVLAGTRTGCYIAATGADYATLQARSATQPNPYTLPGNSLSILANRLSSFFDWNGPSFTLDTACSGSLSALVKACQDLSSGVCEVALAGGINLIADEQISLGLQAGNFMSPRFRCASFDESADGYVRGEGVGCFLLKPLHRARQDGDAIHGVILAHGENHGGRANSLTAPNPAAQAALLNRVYTPELAAQVSYIETHGTGTLLGDPIEIDALKAAWRELCPGPPRQPVWLGAVKSNIGHLEPAAGVASLAKVLLAMEHGVLPANQHFTRLNPFISLDGSPFAILAQETPWASPQVAGISSFGFGGANAHLVVGQGPSRACAPCLHECYLVSLSAASDAALQAMVTQLRDFLGQQQRLGPSRFNLEQLAYTFNTGRAQAEFRLAWVVNSLDDLRLQLGMPTASWRAVPGRNGEVSRYGLIEGVTRHEALLDIRERYLQGEAVDWVSVHQGESGQRVHLPTYRFDTRDYWFDRVRPSRAQGSQA